MAAAALPVGLVVALPSASATVTGQSSVSVGTNGQPADRDVTESVISGNGATVAFVTDATNLGGAVASAVAKVYVRDLAGGTTTMVSHLPGGAAADQHAFAPQLSPDGRYVVFTGSPSGDPVGSPSGSESVYLVDRHSNNAITRVGDGHAPDVSTDGTVVWSSRRPSGDTELLDLWVQRRTDSQPERVDVTEKGQPSGTDASEQYWPQISDDGRYVVFGTSAPGLVAGDGPGTADAFVRDLHTKQTRLVSDGRTAPGYSDTDDALWPVISGNGRWVAFDTYDADGYGKAVLRDLTAGTGGIWVRSDADGVAAVADNGLVLLNDLDGSGEYDTPRRVDVRTGASEQLTFAPHATSSWSASNDGRRVAVVGARWNGEDFAGPLQASVIRLSASPADCAPPAARVAATARQGGPVVGTTNGRQYLYQLGHDGRLYSRSVRDDAGGTWTGWTAMPGTFPAGASVVAGRHSDGRQQVFAIGNDGQLYTRSELVPAGAWSDWTSLGGSFPLRTAMAVGSDCNGRQRVYLVGQNSRLYSRTELPQRRWYDSEPWSVTANGDWTGWTEVGGSWPTTTPITVGSSADGRQQLFMLGHDRQPYTRSQATRNGGWSASWTPMGGTFPAGGAVGVGRQASGHQQLFLIGNDSRLYANTQSADGSFTGWVGLGGSFPHGGVLGLGRNADGRQQVFLIGHDGQLYSNPQAAANGTWEGWRGEGGSFPLRDVVATGATANGRQQLYLVGHNGQLYSKLQKAPNGAWGSWTSWGGSWPVPR